MSALLCPRCGTEHDAAVEGRSADDFCPSCDYPLFFAAIPAPAPAPAAEAEAPPPPPTAPTTATATTEPVPVVVPAALRPCPACTEPNDVATVFCVTCGHAVDADPGPLFDPEPADFPPPPTPSSAAFVLSLLALLVALAALVVALVF